MNRKRGLILILILFTSLFPLIPIPIAKASELVVSISNSYDDVWMTEAGNIFSNTFMVMILDNEIGIHSFLRFQDLEISKTAKINYATLKIYVAETQETPDPGSSVTIYGIDEPDCAPFTSDGSLWSLSRSYTSASVNWNTTVWAGYRSVNVTDIVKEIINQYAWEFGNDLGLQILGGSDSGQSPRSFEDYYHAYHEGQAQLTIVYDVIDEEDEPPEEDPEFVEQYGPYTIWRINGTWDGLSGWAFRREIAISGCDENLTDFQVRIDLGADLFASLPENAPTYQNTPTSDATNQTVHPSILYFPESWNGYKYWMAITPYPGGIDDTETPEILACDDGESWEVPDGLTNPIVARDASNPNTDPFLFYNEATDEIWVYYRKIKTGDYSRLYLKKSSDGVDWSGTGQGTLLLDLVSGSMMSPAVEKVGDTYHLWYIRSLGTPNTLRHRTSADGESWSGEDTQALHGFMPSGKEPWHLEIRYLEEYGVYWMLLNVCNIGVSGAGSIQLFARSVDGVDWYLHNEIFLNVGAGGNWDSGAIYKSTAILDGSDFKIWYSAYKAGPTWHTGYTNVTINLDSLQMMGEMRDDLGDIRFTESDGKTEIPYYIDLPALDGWVKVPSILAIPGNATIYIYYGNPSAETTSNGTDTFIDFESMDNLTLFDDRFDKKGGNDRVFDNTTYSRTTIKLPDTAGDGSTGYNASISWSTNSTYIFEYYYAGTAVGGGYPYGGFYGRGNNGANGLWMAGPQGSTNQNQLWAGAGYAFGVHEEGTLRQWQVILNGTSRTVLNVLIDDGDEYTTDRAFGSAYDPDELWLDAVGTATTGDGWFGTWWIRQYCSLQPETEEWGENETSVDPYYIVTDPNGTVIPTCMNYTDVDDLEDCIDDYIDPGGGDPLDPTPGTQGWTTEGPFTRFKMRLYFLFIGLGCLFAPIWAMAYKKFDAVGYTWCFLIMVLGVGLLWSITGI